MKNSNKEEEEEHRIWKGSFYMSWCRGGTMLAQAQFGYVLPGSRASKLDMGLKRKAKASSMMLNFLFEIILCLRLNTSTDPITVPSEVTAVRRCILNVRFFYIFYFLGKYSMSYLKEYIMYV